MAIDKFAGIDGRRSGLQTIPRHTLCSAVGSSRTHEERVGGKCVRISRGLQLSVIDVVIEYGTPTTAKAGRGDVGAIWASRNAMRKFCRARHIENIVVQIRAIGPALSIRLQKQTHGFAPSHVKRVVVHSCIANRTRQIDAPMVIILADVVADDGAHIANAFRGVVPAFVANQQEPAVVVVAIVVLDNSITAIPIGIEALAVSLSTRAISFVVLNDSIVRTPRPDSDVVSR